MTRPLARHHRAYLTLLTMGVASLLAACGTLPGFGNSVNVLGVNYTDGEFRYRLVDPSNPKNEVGGELIDAFSGGGISCCYQLPRQWRPGIKVRIHTTTFYVPPPQSDGRQRLQRIPGVTEVEVPRYPDGKDADLWVVRAADGSFGLVSSHVQPNHPDWPGAVKGWPKPSLEYRRKKYDVYIKVAEGSLRIQEGAARDFKVDPRMIVQEIWGVLVKEANQYVPPHDDATRKEKADRIELLGQFTGPTDPKFIDWVDKYLAASVEEARTHLTKLRSARP